MKPWKRILIGLFLKTVLMKSSEPKSIEKGSSKTCLDKIQFLVEKIYGIDLTDFYFRALRSLVVLSFPQLLSFSSVFPKPLSETLRRSSDGRISV
jgi:hypothetical protein